MAITIATLADTIATQLGEPYQNLDIRELFDAWVLEVIVEIAQEAPWPFLLTVDTIPTVATQADYTLDAGAGDVLAVQRADTHDELTRTSYAEMVRLGRDLSMGGYPSAWYPNGMSGNQPIISVWPVPSSVINLEVIRSLASTALTRASTFPFPEDLVPLVREGVRQLYREHIQDFQGADRSQMAYTNALGRAKTRYLQPTARRFQFQYTDVGRSNSDVRLHVPEIIS